MEHYYTENPNTPSEPKEITLYYEGEAYPFITDHGVFSKSKLDYGTNLLLKTSMESLEGKVLDLGCGYGPVGVLVYLHRKIICDMVDVNERALDLARKNLTRNHAKGNVFTSDGFSKIHEDYDAILLNPPIRRGKEVIYKLFEDAKEHLTPSGRLLIVIQKKQGMKSAKEKLESIYDEVNTLDKKGGYYILEAKN